jgi:hypothetical protein
VLELIDDRDKQVSLPVKEIFLPVEVVSILVGWADPMAGIPREPTGARDAADGSDKDCPVSLEAVMPVEVNTGCVETVESGTDASDLPEWPVITGAGATGFDWLVPEAAGR